jgi:hypothetical protein
VEEADEDVPVEEAPFSEVGRLGGLDPRVDRRGSFQGRDLDPRRVSRGRGYLDSVLVGRQVLDEGFAVGVSPDDAGAGCVDDRAAFAVEDECSAFVLQVRCPDHVAEGIHHDLAGRVGEHDGEALEGLLGRDVRGAVDGTAVLEGVDGDLSGGYRAGVDDDGDCGLTFGHVRPAHLVCSRVGEHGDHVACFRGQVDGCGGGLGVARGEHGRVTAVDVDGEALGGGDAGKHRVRSVLFDEPSEAAHRAAVLILYVESERPGVGTNEGADQDCCDQGPSHGLAHRSAPPGSGRAAAWITAGAGRPRGRTLARRRVRPLLPEASRAELQPACRRMSPPLCVNASRRWCPLADSAGRARVAVRPCGAARHAVARPAARLVVARNAARTGMVRQPAGMLCAPFNTTHCPSANVPKAIPHASRRNPRCRPASTTSHYSRWLASAQDLIFAFCQPPIEMSGVCRH